MIELTTRKESVVEKIIRLDPNGEEHYSIVVTDRVFSDRQDLTYIAVPYRVSIKMEKGSWERVRVGMEVHVTWSLPDV